MIARFLRHMAVLQRLGMGLFRVVALILYSKNRTLHPARRPDSGRKKAVNLTAFLIW